MYKRLLILLLGLLGGSVNASSSLSNDKMVVSAGVGYSFANDFNNKILGISPYIFDLYTNSHNHPKPSAFLSFKKPLTLESRWVSQVHMGPALNWQEIHYTGQILELGLPLFYNYNYKFHDDLVSVIIEGDVYGRPLVGNFLPYFTMGVGLGAAFANYKDSALAGIPLNTQFQWSGAPLKVIYELGLGIVKPINDQWSMLVRYAYFGTNRLNAEVSSYQPLRFNLNNQNVLVGLNYSLS